MCKTCFENGASEGKYYVHTNPHGFYCAECGGEGEIENFQDHWSYATDSHYQTGSTEQCKKCNGEGYTLCECGNVAEFALQSSKPNGEAEYYCADCYVHEEGEVLIPVNSSEKHN